MIVADEQSKENLRIRLDRSFKSQLDAVFARKGISQQEAVERILGWFLRLDDIPQSIVLGQIEEKHHGDLARMLLEQMAEEGERHQLPPQAERLAAKERPKKRGFPRKG
ncbi:MAG: hypothetical protein WD294_00265 [Phycisphaeraceae bacterium]